MSHINPISPGALSRQEIANGVRFVWYTPGDPSSVKRGVFVSEPHVDDHEESLVSYRLDGESAVRTTDLCTLGITPNARGEWSTCLTVTEEVA